MTVNKKGFTLIELMVVMSIIAMLLTVTLPRYFKSVDSSKEVALRQDLAIMRDALDKYYSDNGKYPATLADLVTRRYLRKIPPDPITESGATWILIPPRDVNSGGVYDVRSGAPGTAKDGSAFAEW